MSHMRVIIPENSSNFIETRENVRWPLWCLPFIECSLFVSKRTAQNKLEAVYDLKDLGITSSIIKPCRAFPRNSQTFYSIILTRSRPVGHDIP